MVRRSIAVSGIVQGVGFRPFVHELASRLGLGGFVRNRGGDVQIELEGATEALDRFFGELTSRPPPLARIDSLTWTAIPPRGDREFRIESSEADEAAPIFIAAEMATCDDCLRELFDPRDRRYRYPFLNCTNCGPRLTIIRGVPYDRERTTMAGFAMCPACRAEYDDPRDRRYHAQPTACPRCGPRLALLDDAGHPTGDRDPLWAATEALREGRIVALKSLGGYHLACDAGSGRAVAELRRRKHRDEKPLAVMLRDLEEALFFCEANEAERTLLTSPRRPIVLLRRRSGTRLAEDVAPGNPTLGVMLPYTPLHLLLMNDLRGRPLVMTSGNRSDEPIAYDDGDAIERLAGIADLFLTNDRPIHMRCDDSVTRVVTGFETPIRRSRGDAPRPLSLPVPCRRPTLALGGQLKATFALGRGRQAFLSHHLGDLEHYAAYRAFVEAVDHYEQLFAIRPEWLVHDLHPDYATTRYARERAERDGIALLGVAHHHAHVASCLAENAIEGPVIGVAFDGTGFGVDGTVWGGEFFLGDLRKFMRAAHLRTVGMPGGEQAIREPWRMAAAHLRDAGLGMGLLAARNSRADIKNLQRMLERGINAPITSSAGRLFDAVSSLAGLRDRVSYEGQAAMQLEWLATGEAPAGSYPFEIDVPGGESPLVVDTRPMICAIAGDVATNVAPARIARRFHTTMVEVIGVVCGRLREESGINDVALSGGVFLNALLTGEVSARLASDGFRVFRHRLVPPSDGGLSLGQLAIAAATAD
jgi:hydrogenase maturation protein HypF